MATMLILSSFHFSRRESGWVSPSGFSQQNWRLVAHRMEALHPNLGLYKRTHLSVLRVRFSRNQEGRRKGEPKRRSRPPKSSSSSLRSPSSWSHWSWPPSRRRRWLARGANPEASHPLALQRAQSKALDQRPTRRARTPTRPTRGFSPPER